MRTTVEFSPALMRAAKARSAERGESLKSLLSRAVAAELGGHIGDAAARRRVTLPLFGQQAGPRANPTNADLERALANADAARAAEPGQPRRRTFR
jgi:hypothetical protein